MINKKNSRQSLDGSKNKERSAKMLQNNCNQHYINHDYILSCFYLFCNSFAPKIKGVIYYERKYDNMQKQKMQERN